jgi:5'-nucleotidase/UDP-sugar diphosphatase
MFTRRVRFERGKFELVGAVACMLLGSMVTGCGSPEPQRLHGQVAVTFLHTSDIHARLFPYKMQIGQIDSKMGLGEVDTIADVGGAARMSHILGRERARASRVAHVDSGDPFQGAPVFNYFDGEAELRTMSQMGLDVMALGNHEFDKGPLNAAVQMQQWAAFPVVIANYMFEDPAEPGASPLGAVTQPYTVLDLDGLRVAFIGMGSLSSLTSIYDMPNKLGITPLQTADTAQFYVDLLRPIVDLVVVVSHLGLNSDQEMIRSTTGIDLLLGGHNHIVLQPPKKVNDCDREDDNGHYIWLNSPDPQDPDAKPDRHKRYCVPRQVVLSHPGAFTKYLGRVDAVVSNDPVDFPTSVYDPLNGFEVLSLDYTSFPINSQVPEDPAILQLLEPYGQGLDALANLDLLVGYAPQGAPRYSTNGGDSALGNMIATAMWLRLGIQTDFSLTNTLGIRADVVPGPVSVEQMFNIFPFDNSISKMQLSGIEVQQMMNFVARRSTGRGCMSQIQIAGARVVIDCTAQDPDPNLPPGVATHIYVGAVDPPQPCANDVECCGGDGLACVGSCDVNTNRCWQPIDPIGSYEMATSNYLAAGGSGFLVLQRNTTQFDTLIQQRDALIDYIRGGKPCGAKPDGTLYACQGDADCAAVLGDNYVCACPGNAIEGELCVSDPGRTCPLAAGAPSTGDGACVLARCRNDVAAFERETCDGARFEAVRQSCESAISPCARGGEECKFLTCLDAQIGNVADGRIRMVGR